MAKTKKTMWIFITLFFGLVCVNELLSWMNLKDLFYYTGYVVGNIVGFVSRYFA